MYICHLRWFMTCSACVEQIVHTIVYDFLLQVEVNRIFPVSVNLIEFFFIVFI